MKKIETKMISVSEKTFVILSWTWGFIETLIGWIIVHLIHLFTYADIKKHGYCYYINVGKYWGGLEFGRYFIMDKDDSDTRVKNHELGHGFQNIWFGPFMVLVSVIGALWYWFRHLCSAIGHPCMMGYDWMPTEGQATRLGTAFIKQQSKEDSNN